MDTNIPTAEWIADDAALARAAQRWCQASVLCLDTEFIRETTFYPVPALIQLHDGHSAWLVDPVPIRDWSPLAAVLADAAITKVFHACQEDVELLADLAGVVPASVMDSQLAAAFAGLGWSLGYRALTQTLCGKTLPDAPHITRSNWLQRPLGAEQHAYAINDVLYLSQAWPLLQQQLQQQGWLDACTDESAARVAQVMAPVDPERLWQQIGGIERLSAVERCIARRLVLWREATAPADDIARNRLLRDGVVLALARLKPTHLAQLGGIEDLRSSTVRRYGAAILETVESGRHDDTALAPLPPSVHPDRMKRLLPRLKAVVVATAARTQLPEALLASRTMLSALVLAFDHGQPLPAWTQGWRNGLLLAGLLQVLEEPHDAVDAV